MDTPQDQMNDILAEVERGFHRSRLFTDGVRQFFESHPDLRSGPLPVIHSTKSRMKSPASLADKIARKNSGGAGITPENVFNRITDLGGVRVLHLHLRQFEPIHEAISKQVADGEWVLDEQPAAYTWDPEARSFFETFGLCVEQKESFYTSVHYLVRPREAAPWCCEIQVRTLFEEIWGEIDHFVNYPYPTDSLAVSEQLRVLAKLVATGSRLADAIFTVHARPDRADERRPEDP